MKDIKNCNECPHTNSCDSYYLGLWCLLNKSKRDYFYVKKVTKDLIKWIKDWFEDNGKDCNAIIGISGGIDSSVATALCVKALGKDRVIGVRLPQNIQNDIDDVYKLIKHLDIESYGINIGSTVDSVLMGMVFEQIHISEQTKINLPPRIRMSTLYAVSQSMNGRVINTSNLSESWVGYDTRYGDSVGDCSPLGNLTKTEIRLIGKELGLPEELVNKTPLDGLCGQTDEERFGFTYEELDKYIRDGVIENVEHQRKIEEMHNKNLFKLKPMPSFIPNLKVSIEV